MNSRLPRPSRRLALLGGTTTLADCAIAAAYLARPRQLVHGPAIDSYESAFARRLGMGHAISFCAARVGLFGVLRALEVGPGDDVILQVPTHVVVLNAIRYCGARPVFVDCRRDTFNLDLDRAESAITPRTKAIVLQHTFGIPADPEQALALTDRHGIALIEDCVHAQGATHRGRPIGSFGRAAIFSTEETKIASTVMGGMVVTDDPTLAAQVRAFQATCAAPSPWLTARYLFKLISYHVMTEPHVHRFTRDVYEGFGRRSPLPRPTVNEELRGSKPRDYAQRFSNGQAAVGLQQLRQLEANVRHRRQLADVYRDALLQYGIPSLTVPPDSAPAYVRYPVWVEDRDAVLRATARYAVLGTWFTSVLEEAVSPETLGYVPGSCPIAEKTVKHLINLPTHQRVTPRDAQTLVEVIASAS